jgi:hypothetical protein
MESLSRDCKEGSRIVLSLDVTKLWRKCNCNTPQPDEPAAARAFSSRPPPAFFAFPFVRVSSRLLWSLGICFGLSVFLGVTFSALWVRSIRKNTEVTAILAENSDLRSRAALTNARLETIEKMLAMLL